MKIYGRDRRDGGATVTLYIPTMSLLSLLSLPIYTYRICTYIIYTYDIVLYMLGTLGKTLKVGTATKNHVKKGDKNGQNKVGRFNKNK